MCGRFVVKSSPQELAGFFDARPSESAAAARPNYNVAPTQDILAVRENEHGRGLDLLRWGLVPAWAKDTKIASRLINARSETAHEKNSFRSSLAKRRCIIAADGFYEWHRSRPNQPKQPYFIHNNEDAPLAFAGLWTRWQDRNTLDEEGRPSELLSATILTCEASGAIAEIHHRMPVILPNDYWEEWLDPTHTETIAIRELLEMVPTPKTRMHPVSVEVNNPRHNDPRLIEAN